ncbi:(4Fe-4S)-binding protein [Kribbella sp. NPDC050820]|uniref:ferredoxin n=1 Tax=Kribbella sp. NPDC050820 TaxID=3155408 RepID=UPI0033F887C4
MRIRADRELCVGAGMCVMTDPAVFEQDPEDGRVIVLRTQHDGDTASVRQAVQLCPSGALLLELD